MTARSYISDKKVEIIISAATCVIILWLLTIFKVNPVASTLIIGLFLVSWVSAYIYDYNRKKGFYNRLSDSVTKLDKAYLILETMEKAEFLEGRLLEEVLYEIDKSMAENVKLYQQQSVDFSEYIEIWLHEVKLPLSAISLKLHNLMKSASGETDEYKKLLEETRRIESLVNQVLYYVRSGSIEKDYHISKVSVADVIHDVAMTYRENLQDNNMDFLIEDGGNDLKSLEAKTDQKWFVFIMGQLISNSIKYKREETQSYVKVLVNVDDQDDVTISIEDNGIGIPEQDIRRVFDKSFTGYNGKERTKSTGMGLYIAKELCAKLGHDINIESEQGQWTRVNIKIYKADYYDVV